MTSPAFRLRDPAAIDPWPSEQPLFAVSVVAALLIWTVVAMSVVGAFYAVMFGAFFAVTHVIFIAHVRGSAVRLGPEQFPELYAAVERLARQVGLEPVPEAYLMQAGGALNAFATKLLRSNLVVFYSDLLEACGDNTAARDMIIAHELGHLRAGHLRWRWLVLPASFVPFLGPALSRAREYTADRYGLAGAGNADGALLGLAILAAGVRHGPRVNRRALVAQRAGLATGLMALGEWLGGHPPLAKRMAALEPSLASGPVPAAGTVRAMAVLAVALGGVMLAGVGAAVVIPKWAAQTRRQSAVEAGAAGDPSTAIAGVGPILQAATPALTPRDSELVATQLDALAQFIRAHWGASAGWPETAAEVYAAYHADLKSQPPMDPFSGRPYGYTRAGDGFVLSSRGPDGVAGTADDITWRSGRGWGRGAQ